MSKSTIPRKAISKRVRFEVFKRDGFTCQYCGQTPPAVTLEPDHIIPVVDGGTNDPMNLVAACRDCNRGKAANRLGDIQPTPDAELARLQKLQEFEELRAYQDSVAAVNAARSEIVTSLADLWCESWRTSYAPEDAIERWVTNYGPEEVHYAIEYGERKRDSIAGSHDRRCYVGAILRNRKNAHTGKTCDACARHSEGADKRLICLLRPASPKGYYFNVYPQSSCANWTEE